MKNLIDLNLNVVRKFHCNPKHVSAAGFAADGSDILIKKEAKRHHILKSCSAENVWKWKPNVF